MGSLGDMSPDLAVKWYNVTTNFKAMFYLLINGQKAMDSPSHQIFSWKSVLIKIMKSWKDLIIETLNIFYTILFVQKYKLNINIKQSW